MSKIQRLDELKFPPKIGECYVVRCMKATGRHGKQRKGRWIPVYGDGHIDKEDFSDSLTGGIDAHIHVDVRFLNNEEIEDLGWNHIRGVTLLMRVGLKPDPTLYRGYEFRHNIRKMRRYWPKGFWGKNHVRVDFEQEYADRKLDLNCKRCPHQGANLDNVSEVDGTILCPNHNLLWNAKDGSLIPKYKDK
jgi:hypothetical protein